MSNHRNEAKTCLANTLSFMLVINYFSWYSNFFTHFQYSKEASKNCNFAVIVEKRFFSLFLITSLFICQEKGNSFSCFHILVFKFVLLETEVRWILFDLSHSLIFSYGNPFSIRCFSFHQRFWRLQEESRNKKSVPISCVFGPFREWTNRHFNIR